MLLEHERYYCLDMDALVTACSWNMNVIMVWAWSSGDRMLLKHERDYVLGVDALVIAIIIIFFIIIIIRDPFGRIYICIYIHMCVCICMLYDILYVYLQVYIPAHPRPYIPIPLTSIAVQWLVLPEHAQKVGVRRLFLCTGGAFFEVWMVPCYRVRGF